MPEASNGPRTRRLRFAGALRAAAFFAVVFLAVAFLAVAFLAVVFLAVAVVRAAVFLALDAAVCFRAVVRLVAVFFAAGSRPAIPQRYRRVKWICSYAALSTGLVALERSPSSPPGRLRAFVFCRFDLINGSSMKTLELLRNRHFSVLRRRCIRRCMTGFISG